jgi:hypothetical protein
MRVLENRNRPMFGETGTGSDKQPVSAAPDNEVRASKVPTKQDADFFCDITEPRTFQVSGMPGRKPMSCLTEGRGRTQSINLPIKGTPEHA